MRRRFALWAAVAMLVLGAAGVAVIASRDSGDDHAASDLPKLPVGAPASPAPHYVPGPGLPAGGGSTPAYRFVPAKKAGAPGVEVDPTGAWSYSVAACANDMPAGSQAPTRSCAPEPPAGRRPPEPEAKRVALDFIRTVGADVEGADVRMEDLGTMWQVMVELKVGGVPAPALASHVTVGAGGKVQWASGRLGTTRPVGDYPLVGTRGAVARLNRGTWSTGPTPTPPQPTITTTPPITVEPPEGPPVKPPGTPPTVTVLPDPEGPPITIEPPEGPPVVKPGPDGPPITIEHPDYLRGSVPATTIPEDAPGIAVGEPDPRGHGVPSHVAVTGARLVLELQASPDGKGFYLVPFYRFTASDGSTPEAPAVRNAYLTPGGG